MRRLIIGAALLAYSAVSAFADTRPDGYAAASQAFQGLSIDQRVNVETLLDAAGFWPAVPNAVFSMRLFNAITQFQYANGLAATGIISPETQDRLNSVTAPLFSQWGFRSISNPIVGRRLWVPMGLGLVETHYSDGVQFSDPLNRVFLDYGIYPRTSLEIARAEWLQTLSEQGAQVGYNVVRNNFFAITAQRGSESTYLRFHRYGDGVLGFRLVFDNTNADLHGDRIETLISSSMWSEMTPDAPSIPLPIVQRPELQSVSVPAPIVVRPPPAAPTPNVQANPPSAAPAPQSPTPVEPKEGFGTGFFVTADGFLLTNAHVVDGCTTVSVSGGDSLRIVHVVAEDAANDLALIKSDITPSKFAMVRTGVRLGEGVEAFGYPLAGILSTSGNFTLGNITALMGVGDNSNYFQISAPVQPGNSGGPLLDTSGNFVGIVTAKLNALKMMVATNGDIAQNVNFAIKASVAANFLESHGVTYKTGSLGAAMQPADIADLAKAISVYVKCN